MYHRRARFREHRRNFSCDENIDNVTGRIRGSPRRHGRPPGLRGKQIGLWYAQRGQERRKNMENNFPSLSLDRNQAKLIGTTLNELGQDDGPLNVESFQRAASSSSSTFENKFSGVIEDLMQRDFDDVKMEIKEKPSDFDSPHKEPMEADDFFSERLNSIKDSKFKRAYAANIAANQNRDRKGLNALDDYVLEVLKRDPQLDQALWEEMQEKQRSTRYQEMLKIRKLLPSYGMKDKILQVLKDNQAIVLSGETGCGKTTQVAQFILDDCIGRRAASTCRIVCTQPRRISAISVSQRVADERAESLGNSVGYQIRLEHSLPRKGGSILFCTTGIVLQWLQSDPLLSGISHLILDEIHERDMHSDFLLCIVKDLLTLRPELKVILMSATLNADQFSQYYGNCPMLHIPGFTFPVKEYYLEDVLEITRYKFPIQFRQNKWNRSKRDSEAAFKEMISSYIREVKDKYSPSTLGQLRNSQSEELDMNLIVELLRHIHKQPPGAVLVFLPGWMQISSLYQLLQRDSVLGGNSYLIIPLHSLMPTVNQREVFNRPKEGVRKIVLATNIAETSITIDDIVYVIDCGRIKLRNYDKESDVSTLLPEWVALSNAKQRKGRAGRVQEGICFHLYTRARESLMMDYQLPELLRTRLEEIILQVKILQLGCCKTFLSKVLEPPDEKVIDTSIEMLRTINAIDEAENLTPLGFHLARLPMDPLTGKMLLMGAIFSCLDPILTVAASLSFKDPFVIPLGKEALVDKLRSQLDRGRASDHLVLVSVYDGWETAARNGYAKEYTRENFVSHSVLEQLRNMRRQFLDALRDNNFIASADELNRNSKNLSLVKAIITAGLYPNVARILVDQWGRRKVIRLRDIRRVNLHPKSVNEKVKVFQGSWMVYWEKMKSTKVFLHDTTVVMNYPLLFFGQKLDYDSEQNCINVDGFVKIRCEKYVAQVIKNLRRELDLLLEHKIAHPGPPQWDRRTKEGVLLNAIVDLISSEKPQTPSQRHQEHDDAH